jgi:hypothetical protein
LVVVEETEEVVAGLDKRFEKARSLEHAIFLNFEF